MKLKPKETLNTSTYSQKHSNNTKTHFNIFRNFKQIENPDFQTKKKRFMLFSTHYLYLILRATLTH